MKGLEEDKTEGGLTNQDRPGTGKQRRLRCHPRPREWQRKLPRQRLGGVLRVAAGSVVVSGNSTRRCGCLPGREGCCRTSTRFSRLLSRLVVCVFNLCLLGWTRERHAFSTHDERLHDVPSLCLVSCCRSIHSAAPFFPYSPWGQFCKLLEGKANAVPCCPKFMPRCTGLPA